MPTPPATATVRSTPDVTPVYGIPFSIESQTQASRYNPLTGKVDQGVWVRFTAPSINYSGELFVPLANYPQDARSMVASNIDAAASVHG